MSKNAAATMMGLSKVPVIAWPSMLLFIGSISAFVITTFFAISGGLKLVASWAVERRLFVFPFFAHA